MERMSGAFVRWNGRREDRLLGEKEKKKIKREAESFREGGETPGS